MIFSKKVNFLYITSTNWSKDYFDLAIKKYLKSLNIIADKCHVICVSEDSKKLVFKKNSHTYSDFFPKINGNIGRIFNKSKIQKFHSIIDHLNSSEWTIVTDNEMRNHELLFCASLKLNKDLPLIILDHGLKNSQDNKFFEYLGGSRFIRNLYIVYAFLCSNKNLKDLFNIKIRRLYFHYKKPTIRMNKFFEMGLVDLEREILSYKFKENKYSSNKSLRKSILILTSGAYRYNDKNFRDQSLITYKKILSNTDFAEFDIIIKTKPREDINLIKKELFTLRKDIIFYDNSLKIADILKIHNIFIAITLYQSISLASLSLMKIKTFGYFIYVPKKLRVNSYFYNFYKPKKIYKLFKINGLDIISLEYDKLLYYFNNTCE